MTKRLVIVVAMVALLGLQFADCMSAATQAPQSMKCCGSIPCDPSNQSYDCCKGMVSSQRVTSRPCDAPSAGDEGSTSRALDCHTLKRMSFLAFPLRVE